MLNAVKRNVPEVDAFQLISGEYELTGDTHHRRGFLQRFGARFQVDPALSYDQDLIILAFSNRSGSNHLAEYITSAPEAYGFREDLNREHIDETARGRLITSFDDYLDAMLAFQRKPDAAFGVKASGEQIRLIYESGMHRCFNSVKILRARRRDRISQAVSLYIARRTHQWSSEMEAQKACPEYDLHQLRLTLDDVQKYEGALDLALSALTAPKHDVFYEDFCADPDLELTRLSEFLGFALPRNLDAPKLLKQSSSRKSDMVARFQDDLLRGWEMAGPAAV